jgi:hypothetical protein
MPIQLPDEDAPPKPARRRGWAFGCFTTGFGVAVLFALYLWWANTLPAMPVIARPPEPSPNGYQPLNALMDRMATNPAWKTAGNGISTPMEQLRPALVQMRPQMDELRTTLRLPYRIPRYDPNEFHRLAPLRNAARCFAGEAWVALADGNPGAAMSSSLDAVELGAKSENGGPLIDELVGIAICSIGLRTADDAAVKLLPAQAREERLRLERILAEFPPEAEMVRLEEEVALTELRKAWRSPPRLKSDFTDEPLPLKEKVSKVAARYLWPKIWSQNALERYYDAQARDHARPPWQRTGVPPPQDPFAPEYGGVFGAAAGSQSRLMAELQLIRLSLALNEFHGSNGRYPAALDELAPLLGGPSPPDPFTGKPFPYRLEGNSFVLYSVGENRVDDGGTPGQLRTGDLVVGRLFPQRPRRAIVPPPVFPR